MERPWHGIAGNGGVFSLLCWGIINIAKALAKILRPLDTIVFIAMKMFATVIVALSIKSLDFDTFSFTGSWGQFNFANFWSDQPLSNSEKLASIGFGVVLFIFGEWLHHKDVFKIRSKFKKVEIEKDSISEKLDDAENEIQLSSSRFTELQQEMAKVYVRSLFNRMDLSQDDRVSLYMTSGDEANIVARYSTDLEHGRIHRLTLPIEGVLKKSLNRGEFHENDCQKYDEQAPDGYLTFMEERYDYNQSVTSNLTMKSCRYFGQAIESGGERVGVILVESTNDDNLSNDKVSKIRSIVSKNNTILAKIIEDSLKIRESLLEFQGKSIVSSNAKNLEQRMLRGE